MKRYAVFCFLVVLPGFLLSACGGTSPQATSPPNPQTTAIPQEIGSPVDGDWLVQRLSNEPAHLNPLTSSDAYASGIMSFIFDSLIERDNATLAIKPSLAESWDIAPDHLTYTFRLRKGVVFSDGQPLTAHDVKFTFDKLMDPTTDAAALRNYYQDVASCEILDEHAIRFVCKKPYFKHLTMLGGLRIIPRHVYAEGDFNSHPNNRKPVGSGPYVFEKWETGLQIVLARNETYWQEKPHILKYVYKIITDATAAFQVLDRQELDTMTLTPELYVNRALKPEFQAKFATCKYSAPMYNYVGWNLRRPLFQDKRVRQALTMLLDRRLILDTIYYGLGKEVTGEAFVESPEYDPSIQPLPFDPAKAKQMLDAAGWIYSEKDGVRMKDGVPFRFEMLIRASSPEAEQVATVFQEELKRANIAMKIRPLEWATFLQSVDGRNFDSVILGWSIPPIEQDPYQVWHSSQAENGSNFVGFVNAEADRIMEEARLEFDEPTRFKMYHRFQAILYDEQPYTFLFCLQELDAVHKRFQNVNIYKFGLDSREWWVPAGAQKYR
ncbi:MAG TPA: peptide-binding protein [Candidatus Hydrogenedentes bacterium]|mgnify:FL=1|nr:peptide-binding protein [Candidatus Hydrogenedentota bacterium]HOV75318.1 peptide-binding protein [Candidatus Hydrogenedentota bacterium]